MLLKQNQLRVKLNTL